jgi:hypothetical protein
VLATADELALAALVGWLLLARRATPGWAVSCAWALAAAGGISAFLGPHGPS